MDRDFIVGLGCETWRIHTGVYAQMCVTDFFSVIYIVYCWAIVWPILRSKRGR